MSPSSLQMSRRIRRTPYTRRVEQCGVRGYSVVNHMILPKAFGPDVEDDYWHLRENVQVWDVSTQRQVALQGPNAADLVQWMTPRDLTDMQVGQCRYAPLVDEHGCLINDPVLLKLSPQHFWLSIADSDVLLWAKGLARGANLDVCVTEPDVSPLAVQGPKAEEVVAGVFGDAVRALKFFQFGWFPFAGTQQLVARSGYSRQGGFEIYLHGAEYGEPLWDAIWDAGVAHNIRAGCPNLIERIEGGLLSYGNEFTRDDNPIECGLSAFCDLDADIETLGGPALRAIVDRGVERNMRGIQVAAPRQHSAVTQPWPVYSDDEQIGIITSGIWSPRLKTHVGLSILPRAYWEPGQSVVVMTPDGSQHDGIVSALPFP
ncbi:MAG: dimethylsulfoniopropionate demethylase [Pseudomonadota bacterium]